MKYFNFITLFVLIFLLHTYFGGFDAHAGRHSDHLIGSASESPINTKLADYCAQEEQKVQSYLENNYKKHNVGELVAFNRLAEIYHLKSFITKNDLEDQLVQNIKAYGLLQYSKRLQEKLGPKVTKTEHQGITNLKKAITHTVCQLTGISQRTHDNLFIRNYKKDLDKLRTDVSETALSDSQVVKTYRSITKKRNAILINMFKDAIDVLGIPPYKYAVILYGSSSRDEATPYSDVEFGLVIENDRPENHNYFKKLSALVIMKILGLSESITPYLGIKALAKSKIITSSHQSDNKRWFFDTIIAHGFSIDPLDSLNYTKMPISSKLSLACFGTPEQILSVYNTADTFLQGGHPMMTSSLLHGNKTLYKTYLQEYAINYKLTFKNRALDTYNDLRKHYLNKTITKDDVVDLKKTFLRPTLCLLESLSVYYQIREQNSHKRIHKLNTLGVVSTHDARTLSQFINVVMKLRLEMHMHYKRNKDICLPITDKRLSTLFDMRKKCYAIFKKIQLKG